MDEGEGPPPADPLAEGVRLFNTGFYFEAHEVLEEAWREERGESRRFLQGLIQLCAGYHHWTNGNPVGAASLFEKAIDKFREYPDDYMGVDLGRLRVQLADARMRLGRGEGAPDAAGVRILRRAGISHA